MNAPARNLVLRSIHFVAACADFRGAPIVLVPRSLSRSLNPMRTRNEGNAVIPSACPPEAGCPSTPLRALSLLKADYRLLITDHFLFNLIRPTGSAPPARVSPSRACRSASSRHSHGRAGPEPCGCRCRSRAGESRNPRRRLALMRSRSQSAPPRSFRAGGGVPWPAPLRFWPARHSQRRASRASAARDNSPAR